MLRRTSEWPEMIKMLVHSLALPLSYLPRKNINRDSVQMLVSAISPTMIISIIIIISKEDE